MKRRNKPEDVIIYRQVPVIIPDRYKRLRHQRGMTLKEVAMYCRVSIAMICEVEHGRKEAKGDLAICMVEALR